MKEYLPYVVSIVTAILSFLGSLWVNRRNNKADIEKMKIEHAQIMERNKQEQDARIAELEKEYALKLGSEMISGFTDKTLDAVYSSNAVKSEINKQAFNSIKNRKSGRRGHK